MEYWEIYVKRIKQLCIRRGISINKLSTMSDVKQSTLDNIVRGQTKNPRVKTLHKIAIAFNMTLAEFLDFDELTNTHLTITIRINAVQFNVYRFVVKAISRLNRYEKRAKMFCMNAGLGWVLYEKSI